MLFIIKKILSTGADVPDRQKINSINFWKFGILMSFSSNFLNIWTHFCTRDAFYQLSSSQHLEISFFTSTSWSNRESLSITCFLNVTLILFVDSRGGVEDTRLEAKDTKENPRPRPKPRTAFPRTDTLEAKDRNARGQGQGPRTQAQVLSKKKKKRSSQKFFRRSQKKKKKKAFTKNFSGDLHKSTFSKKFFKRSTSF